MRLAPSAIEAIIAYWWDIDLSPGSAIAPDTRGTEEMRFCMSAVSSYCTRRREKSADPPCPRPFESLRVRCITIDIVRPERDGDTGRANNPPSDLTGRTI